MSDAIRWASAFLLSLTLLCGQLALGKAKPKLLETISREADFIGVIDVLSIQDSPDTALTRSEGEHPYLSLATVRIVDTIKGELTGDTFELMFDNGLACPNALYESNTRYLVFLDKLADDLFATNNQYVWQFVVEGPEVLHWNSYGEHEAVEVARKQIVMAMATQKE